MSQDTDSQSRRYWPLAQLVKVRVLEFVREPAAIFWVYGFPVLMMIALGVAFRNRPVEQSTVAVQTNDNSPWVVSSLRDDPQFRVSETKPDEADDLLRTGKAELIIIANSDSECTYRYDPTRPGSVLARNRVDDVLQRRAGRQDVLGVQEEEFAEPGGRYIDFLLPGLIALGLMGGGLWGVGFAIVDLRIRNVLRRFLATPMKKTEFLGSVMISRLVFTIPEVMFLLLIGRLMFGVEVAGSYLLVTLLIVLGAFEFAGIGLLAASRAKTLETVSGIMNLIMLPMWVASGVFFSADRFPDMAQPLIRVLPLTALVDALRKVMLEGLGMSSMLPELAIMITWMVVTFVLALSWFRWN